MKKTKIISFANQKGGVGKTTTCMNIGAALSKKGYKVLLVDLDPQANLSSYLGYESDNLPDISTLMYSVITNSPIDFSSAIHFSNVNNIDYIPSSLNLSSTELSLYNALSRETVLRRILKSEAFSDYDYILIDCLPSLGILFINALASSDSLVIPVQAQKFALDGLSALLGNYEQIKATINPEVKLQAVIATMVDNTNMAQAVVSALQQQFGELFLNNTIRRSVEATNSTYEQKALVLGSTNIGNDYITVTNELVEKIGG
jgi:chromosome partitioning protein